MFFHDQSTYYYQRYIYKRKNNTISIKSEEKTYEYGIGYIQYIFEHANILINSDVIRKAFERGIELIFHHGMAKGKKAFLFDTIEPYRPYCEKIMIQIAHLNPNEPGILGTGLIPLELRKKLIEAFNNEIYQNKTPMIKKIEKDFKNIALMIKSGQL